MDFHDVLERMSELHLPCLSRNSRECKWNHTSLRLQRPLEEVVVAHPVPPPPVRKTATAGKIPCLVETKLNASSVGFILALFENSLVVKEHAVANGISPLLFSKCMSSFRSYLLQHIEALDAGTESALLRIHSRLDDVHLLFAHFLNHSRLAFPHLLVLDQLRTVADFTRFHEHTSFAKARRLRPRHFTYYAGPANSGKTYEALNFFRSTRHRAVYCCPLRLLAVEVYEKMICPTEMGLSNCNPIPCDLVTGTEHELYPGGATHTSCTIEMVDLGQRYDVAVIDEIQMLGHKQRGWAWTRALFGLAADRIYLCGDLSAIPLVRKLLAMTGETLSDRDVKLKVPRGSVWPEPGCLGSYGQLRDGDCVISFSKRDLFMLAGQLKSMVPLVTFYLVYGDLPNLVKLRETDRFNQRKGPGIHVLLATDAVGMGLNLNINRMVFHTLRRTGENTFLTPAEVQQIAGRAARMTQLASKAIFSKTVSPVSTGQVLALRNEDHRLLSQLLTAKVPNLEVAGVQPIREQLEEFSRLLPHHSFVELLDIFDSVCHTGYNIFHLCRDDAVREWERILRHLPLTIHQMYVFCHVPVKPPQKRGPATGGKHIVPDAVVKMATKVAEGGESAVISYDFIRELVTPWMVVPKSIQELNRLTDAYEVVHTCIWLSFRFQQVFMGGRRTVEQIGELHMHIVRLIEECLVEKSIF